MNRKQTIAVIVVAITLFFLVGLKYLGGFFPFSFINDQIVNPIGSGFSSFGRSIKEGFDTFAKATELARQNKQQDQEIVDLKLQLSTLKEIASENEQLRSQLNFNEKLDFEMTAARVVSAEGTSLRKYITIDRGKKSGLALGMPVVSSGVLVGIIDSVEDYSAKVFLATDPEFRIRAIGQDGRAQGVVRGQLGRGYLFDKITQTEKISNSELVITSGSGLVPKGILIGQVETVQKSDNAVFQSAQLSPLINFDKLDIVFIVTGLKQ